ncbi:MAG: hypothetical protein M1829_000245 [Trizodia sp. TS-e1964]|nr:MAG: hypothetical protein M1829_000245 [Trizodia sp. TS-e1964]
MAGKSKLSLYNSLSRKKDEFVPIDPAGKYVKWYACGPTVYDASHLGHARNYVSTDIARRILQDYFKYDVKYVMNITDVDDKQFGDPGVLDTTLAAYSAYLTKNLPLLDPTSPPERFSEASKISYAPVLNGAALEGDGPPGDAEAKIKMHLETLTRGSEALIAAKQENPDIEPDQFYLQAGDILRPYLDSLYGAQINTQDNSIFTTFTKYWEAHFMEDLRTLNCLPPNVVTRVTEYMPEIVEFVKKIVEKGFAYPTPDGSVYFDIAAFEEAGNTYARLEPQNRNDKNLQADGEGSLTKKNIVKRNEADFALWKSSKPGEPSWGSPWGRGRPGWHIECSAMASEIFGDKLDIHSGGIDLAFPHHDNEIAQSEAYYCQKGHEHFWVNYFLHMGHLSISGSKMSKSLKNFITIREALKKGGGWTPRGIRIVFLLGGWRDGIEITPDVVSEGRSWEATLANFFRNIRAYSEGRQFAAQNSSIETQASQLDLKPTAGPEIDLTTAENDLHTALCDSLNTRKALATIAELITKVNNYIRDTQQQSLDIDYMIRTAKWITHITRIFGLSSPHPSEEFIGWDASSEHYSVSDPQVYRQVLLDFESQLTHLATTLQPAEILSPLLSRIHHLPLLSNPAPDPTTTPSHWAHSISSIRDLARELALSTTPPLHALLSASDTLRTALLPLGIQLDDRDAPHAALVKFAPAAELLAQRAAKAAQQLEADAKREQARVERERAEAERRDRGRVSHLEMFRTEEWGAWDDDGLPVRDARGEEVSKSRAKKLRKEWDRQRKAHEAWLGEGREGSR